MSAQTATRHDGGREIFANSYFFDVPLRIVEEGEAQAELNMLKRFCTALAPCLDDVKTGLRALGSWLRDKRIASLTKKRLHLAESVSLGEKRFIAIVKVDGQDFLLAASPSNICLLAQLLPSESFGEALQKQTVPG